MTDAKWRKYQHKLEKNLEDVWANAQKFDKESCMTMLEMMDNLSRLRGKIQSIEQTIHYGQAADVKKFYGMEPAKVIH